MAEIYERTDSRFFWCSFVSPQGNRIRRSTKIPNKPELRKKADLAAANIELAAWEGWHPKKKTDVVFPFEQLMVGYINEQDPGKGHLWNITKLQEFFIGLNLAELCAADINSYKSWRREASFQGRKTSNSTIRRELAVFSSAINYARREWEWDIPNPIEGRLPEAGESRIRWITPLDAKRLVEAAKLDPRHPHLPDFIELALSTGMRKSEILQLEIKRIDLRQQVIHLNPEHHKNRTNATVPLNKTARKVIMRRLSHVKQECPGSKLAFPNLKQDPDGLTPFKDVKKGFSASCERAKISDFRIHDLRHTFASWLIQAGVHIYVVKDLMRHKSITQTEKYAHLAPRNKADSVDIIDGLLGQNLSRFETQTKNDLTGALEIIDEISIESRG